MLLLLSFLLGCAPLLAANPVGTHPNAASPPVGTPSIPTGAPHHAAALPVGTLSVSQNAPVAPVGSPSIASPPEQEALLALRAEWQDPRGYLVTWSASSGLPWCSWWGVTCTNSSVTSLYLSRLSLSGTLSPAIANLFSLSTLNLAFNKLSGHLPPELGSLPSLTRLQLGHNSFNGSIPGTLFLSPSLEFLQLENNSLSGEISSAIANLVHLRYLSLQYNSLTGPIPPSITTLTKLSAIYLGFNRIKGTIPLHIGDLNRLIYLHLQNNLISGAIPSSIGSLINLKQLVLRNNQLVGPIPAELGELQHAIVIDLSYNSLNGTIPAEMGNLSSLQTLDLCNNDLAGIIPASIGNCAMLKSLNMSYNNLSGEVPSNGILANFNATSYVGNKLLCGGGGTMSNRTCATEPNPMPTQPGGYIDHRMPYQGTNQLGKNGKVTIAVVVGAFGLVVICVCLAFCSCKREWTGGKRTRTRKRSESAHRNSFSFDVADSMRKAKLEVYMQGFTHTYEEIVSHAGYFDTAHVIGKGRFATVYRSDLPGGKQLAVKVFKNPITQSTFEREMASLTESACQVSTLLPIRGYYSNPIEKAIFYDFMPMGTLHGVLHGAPTLLDWSKRLNIALGVAQALAHLHKGSPLKVLHKDFKSTNVLLNDNLCPLVADYGLLELVSKSIVQTPGYTPPEFMTLSSSRKRYTEKTDAYNFGVVLLELLTGKSPVSDMELDTEEHLVTWALGLHATGQGLEVLDAFVVESCPSPDHPLQALNLAILCLNEEPSQRPTMCETTSILEGLVSKHSPISDHQSRRPLLK